MMLEKSVGMANGLRFGHTGNQAAGTLMTGNVSYNHLLF
jgi:hypothetical protein